MEAELATAIKYARKHCGRRDTRCEIDAISYITRTLLQVLAISGVRAQLRLVSVQNYLVSISYRMQLFKPQVLEQSSDYNRHPLRWKWGFEYASLTRYEIRKGG